jgi:hypothetical protein
MIAVLTTMLGLGFVGAGLTGPGSSLEVAAKGPYRSVSRIVPSATSSPPVFEEQVTHDLASYRSKPLTPRPDHVVASIADDPRKFLQKMAMLQRRLTRQNRASDPYQASLNPAVYGGSITIDTTPIARDCNGVVVPGDQRCRVP